MTGMGGMSSSTTGDSAPPRIIVSTADTVADAGELTGVLISLANACTCQDPLASTTSSLTSSLGALDGLVGMGGNGIR